jgi:hypothetical protein
MRTSRRSGGITRVGAHNLFQRVRCVVQIGAKFRDSLVHHRKLKIMGIQ